jgi:hypothetical protein
MAMKKRNSTLPRIDVEFCGFFSFRWTPILAEFCPHQMKRNLFIYLFIYFIYLFKIFKKKLLSQIPYFLGGKKKVLGTFFPHTFQFWFSVSFPTVWRVLFNFIFLKPNFWQLVRK